MNEHKKTDWTPLAEGLGWCFIWLGVGGCCMMVEKDNKTPIIEIRNSYNYLHEPKESQ